MAELQGRASTKAEFKGISKAWKRIKKLPSAQPEVLACGSGELDAQPEIIRCKDCKWKNNHNCTRAVEVWIDDNKYCAWAERREE